MEDSMCRSCLQALAEDTLDISKYDIFLTPDLAKKLGMCTSLTVEPLDGFPKYLCECCYDKVADFHQFQTMCVESVQRFRKLKQLEEVVLLDEKPVFDLEDQPTVEITVSASDVLRCDSVKSINNLIEVTNQKRRGRPAKAKRLCEKASKIDLEIGELPAKRNRRSKQDLEKNKNADKTLEMEENLETTIDQWDIDVCSASDSNEDADSDDEFLLAKQMRKTGTANKQQNNELVASHTHSRVKRKYCKRSSDQCANDKSALKSSIFQCDVCPTRFFVEHRLVAHKRSHDGLVPYPCPRDGCERSFNRWHCLSEHLKQHEGTNNWFTCKEQGCNKVYKHKPTLIMHMRKYHKLGPELKSHVCEICGKVFKASAILNDHRYTHKDKSELPHACNQPQCQRRFSNKEKLKVHLLRHAGIKNFECPYCGMRKTTRNELNIHINYHTLERTWPCRFCAHICNSAGNLKMHVRTVHERAKDYACRYCERTFAKPDTRKYHEMTHTGEKPNECLECGKRFTQPAALRTHRKIHQRHLQNATTNETTPTIATLNSDVENPTLITAETSLCDLQRSSLVLLQESTSTTQLDTNLAHMLQQASVSM